MAVKFLDKTGLGYFWSKIKAWCNATFAAITHNQASNTINAMTSYSKPSSGSAITTSDSLNTAIGKLEAKVDSVDDSNYVHLTGNEDISDFKTFQNINLRIRDVTKGTVPSSTVYKGLYVCDSSYDADSGDNWKVHRIGAVEFGFGSDNVFGTFLRTYANISNTGTDGTLSIFYDTDNSVAFATAPSTPDTRNGGEDILTRNWIPKDTRIVHTTGDETVGGKKTFTEDVFANKYIYIKDSDVQAGTAVASNKYRDLSFVIKNAAGDGLQRGGVLEAAWYASGASRLVLSAYHYTDLSKPTADIVAGHDSSGNPYTAAVTPPSDSNGTDIATTAWTNSKYVNLTSAQTIGGTKTFSNEIIVRRANPYVHCFETDVTCGTGIVSGVSSYAGYGFGDKNDNSMGDIIGRYYGVAGDKHYFVHIRALDCTGSTPASATPVGMMRWANGVLSFMPESTNVVLLGGSSRRWKEVWCNQSSMNSSSDERLKEDIDSIPDEVLDAWEDINWIQYRFKDANKEKHGNARLHTGAIAQRVDEVFSNRGLDASQYGFFLHDEWGETPEAKDANGNILQTYQAAGDEYGLRYVEALCVEAAYQRRKNKILENRISELERQVSDMLQILQSLKGAN